MLKRSPSPGSSSASAAGSPSSQGARHRAIEERTFAQHNRLAFDDVVAPRLTHYLFRFPAKFHPPVVHSLIRSFTAPGETIFDPFCGSGTLLVSAAVEGRHAIGADIDPVAVFVSDVKTHRFRPGHLRASWESLRSLLERRARPLAEYDQRQFSDLSADEYNRTLAEEALWVPNIPNLFHWFRRYVIVDLARILQCIAIAPIAETHRAFFRLIHASIIRNASNADPVPVSGLEVTKHMRQREALGRTINPFALFTRAVSRGLGAVADYWEASTPRSRVRVWQRDARRLSTRLSEPVDAVITSPPYLQAVDYYRRHQLEMFWLRLAASQTERLRLLPHYIGRARIRKRDPALGRLDEMGPLSSAWHHRIQAESSQRADAFAHYVLSMKDAFKQVEGSIRAGGPLVVVIGDSRSREIEVPTSDLFVELAGPSFCFTERFWYPVKNRYMSYERNNGSGITKESVLVFRRSYS